MTVGEQAEKWARSAGVTPESHERALLAMKACQIEVEN